MSDSSIMLTHARDLREGEFVINRTSRQLYRVDFVGEVIVLISHGARLTRTPQQLQANWRRPLPWEIPTRVRFSAYGMIPDRKGEYIPFTLYVADIDRVMDSLIEAKNERDALRAELDQLRSPTEKGTGE